MKRPFALTAVALIAIAPTLVHAKVDPACPGASSTSAITGVVQNAKGQPLQGMTVELALTNDQRTTGERAETDGNGFYRICAGENGAAGHNTYDVRVTDERSTPLYAAISQPYSTWANATGDADFTPSSDLPMLYKTNLTITPAEITTRSGAVTVEFIARSKAPSGTTMRLTIGHTNDEVTMTADGIESGGPASGGWNRWRTIRQIPAGAHEALYWASIRGFDGAIEITQIDRQPYVIDNKPPLLGPASSSVGECGPGVTVGGLSPVSPPGTTNPMPVVLQGVCDGYSGGARSGLDPFSLTGLMCRDPDMSVGCEEINPVLNTFSIVWYPTAALAKGDYFFRWSIADRAGNRVTNETGRRLTITDRGGQMPLFSGVTPGNLGSGTSLGVVVGSGLTSPSSFASIGVRVTDADGQRDLVPGTLTVRVYYANEQNLVYEYDPFAGPNQYDPVTRKGGGTFNLESGGFQATGYPLQGKPPGRYIATASVTDHGGNTSTVSWHWLLGAAA